MYDRVLCRVYVLHHGGGLSMPKIYHMNAKTSKISQSLFNHKQCLSIEFFVNMLLQNGKQSFEPYISKTDSFDVVYNENSCDKRNCDIIMKHRSDDFHMRT